MSGSKSLRTFVLLYKEEIDRSIVEDGDKSGILVSRITDKKRQEFVKTNLEWKKRAVIWGWKDKKISSFKKSRKRSAASKRKLAFIRLSVKNTSGE